MNQVRATFFRRATLTAGRARADAGRFRLAFTAAPNAQLVTVQPTPSPAQQAPTEAEPEPQAPALVVRWFDRGTFIPNLQNPRSYTRAQKIAITIVVAVCSFSAPFASNILMPSFPFIGPALRLDSTTVALTSEYLAVQEQT